MSEESATAALFDAVALWEVRSTLGADEVVTAAVDALVAGVDSPSLRELAGVSAKAEYWTLRPVVEDSLDELNIPYPGPSSDEVQIAATRVMCKRLLRGSLTPRAFAAWAHSTIGHERAARLQSIVELDDEYKVCEYTGYTFEDLEVAAHQEARSLVAGELPPVRSEPTMPTEMRMTPSTPSRFRSALRHARSRLTR